MDFSRLARTSSAGRDGIEAERFLCFSITLSDFQLSCSKLSPSSSLLHNLTSELHDLTSELKKSRSELHNSSFLLDNLCSELHNSSFLLKNKAQNSERRAFCSNLRLLSLNCQVSSLNYWAALPVAVAPVFAFRGLRTNRCPISFTIPSKPDPCPLAFA